MGDSAKPGSRPTGRTGVHDWYRFAAERGLLRADGNPIPLADMERATADTGGVMLQFVGWLLHAKPNISGDTLANYCSRARAHLGRVLGQTPPSTALYERVLLRLRQVPTVKLSRVAVTVPVIRDIVADESSPLALRAAIAVAWSNLLRSREYLAEFTASFNPASTLLRRHVRPGAAPGSFDVTIVHSKSDTYNSGTDIHIVQTATDDTCPAQWLHRFLQHRDRQHLSWDTPLFSYDDGTFVTREHVTAVLRRHAPAHGLPADRVSSHSIRIGGCFRLANAGVDWETIALAVVGRWTSNAMPLMYARMSLQRMTTAAKALALDPATADVPLFTRA